MDDHVGLIIALFRQVEELTSRLKAIEHIVNERIIINCPVEGCSATFTTKGHRNRHVKDWVRKKAEHEPLWKEHKRALNDDQNSDSDQMDDPQDDHPPVLRSAPITPPSRGFAGGVRDAARDGHHTQHYDMLQQLHYPAISELELAARSRNLPPPPALIPSGNMADMQPEMNSRMDVDISDTNHEEGDGKLSPIPFGFDKYWFDTILYHYLRSINVQTGGQSGTGL
ncbi:hypothetical protein F4809DRAFT_253515 [Biscogniauxia mediterranea]|nr:hypothetical protein F4809DRAFT_253515 [Biscogniauxia mediterranea]